MDKCDIIHYNNGNSRHKTFDFYKRPLNSVCQPIPVWNTQFMPSKQLSRKKIKPVSDFERWYLTLYYKSKTSEKLNIIFVSQVPKGWMVFSRTALHHLKSWSRLLKPETAPDLALTEVLTIIKNAILYLWQLTFNIEVVFFCLSVNQWETSAMIYSEIKILCPIQILYISIYSI